MDSDYSVFSILPPYNTVEAQLIVGGKLVTSGAGYTVTYQAVADPAGSLNSTSVGKGNFYSYAAALYGASLAPDQGLAGWNMPGAMNVPQGMLFEPVNQPAPGASTPVNWFRAEGIPITPLDDARRKNTYPMMLLVARDSSGRVIANAPVVLPVSDEMDCRACHASGTGPAARPTAGWVNDANPDRDYRLNILRLHDERQLAQHAAVYAAALAANSYNSNGLFSSVITDQKPILCANCHASAALGKPGFPSVPSLTAAVHSGHAMVNDPVSNTPLNSANNRAACYRCHPGSETRCLRGAMGTAVAADGSMQMQCQSCHGTMSQVGAANRLGWLSEPSCQSCHTGTALSNSGQIRYTSVFADPNGTVRQPADRTFATTPDTPAAGLSLYRFSVGHGGLQCEACHGSTHAEFPSSHTNDNVLSLQVQGHVGVVAECNACHAVVPNTVDGGPHGMHPIGQGWVGRHGDLFEHGGADKGLCRACHGLDYRGTVLSRAQADRLLSRSEGAGTVQFFRGELIGCYNCHNGPGGSSDSSRPVVRITSPTSSPSYTAAAATLTLGGTASDTSGLARVVWSNDRGGAGVAVGTTTWRVEGIALRSGINVITVTAYDVSGNSGVDTLTVVYGSSGSLTVLTSPGGTVSPNMNGRNLPAGSRVTLTAKPSAGYIFANWTGSILAAAPRITFILQTNMVLQANFVPNPFSNLKSTYSGLYSDSAGIAHQGSGGFTLVLTAGGVCSGKLQTGQGRYSFSGQLDFQGAGRFAVNRRGMAPLAVELHLDVTNNTGKVAGTVNDGSSTSALSGTRAALQAQPASYTMIFPGQAGASGEPAGDSWATVTVNRSARVRLIASLADGTPFTQSAVLSPDGIWPLYTALYRGQGHVWSWMAFTNGAAGGAGGAVTWVKPANAGTGSYPNGFTMETAAYGSSYARPAAGSPVLGYTDAVLVLSAGNPSGSSTNYIVLNSRGSATATNKLTLSVSASTGAFKGRVLDPVSNGWVPFSGVVLQNRNNGAGWFPSGDQCGRVYLGPAR